MRLPKNNLHNLNTHLTRHYLPLGRRISAEGFGVSWFGLANLIDAVEKDEVQYAGSQQQVQELINERYTG